MFGKSFGVFHIVGNKDKDIAVLKPSKSLTYFRTSLWFIHIKLKLLLQRG